MATYPVKAATEQADLRCIGVDISFYCCCIDQFFRGIQTPSVNYLMRVQSGMYPFVWPHPHIPYTIADDGNPKLSEKVNEAIKIFNSKVQIWNEREHDDDFLEFRWGDQSQFKKFKRFQIRGKKQEVIICDSDEIGDVLYKMGYAAGFNYAGMHVAPDKVKDDKLFGKEVKSVTDNTAILILNEKTPRSPEEYGIKALNCKEVCTIKNFHKAIEVIQNHITQCIPVISNFYWQCSTCWGSAKFPCCFPCISRHHPYHNIDVVESDHGVLSFYGCVCWLSNHELKCTRNILGSQNRSQPYYTCTCAEGRRYCFPCAKRLTCHQGGNHQTRETNCDQPEECSDDCIALVPLPYSIDL